MKILPVKLLLGAVVYILLVEGAEVGLLSGVHLKLPAYHQPPRMTISKDAAGNLQFGGMVVDVVIWLQQRLKFSYEFVVFNQSEFAGRGLTPTLISALVDKRIDLMAASITATTERLKLIDVSFPVLVDAFVILQPVPKEESPLMTIVRPFKMTVWMLLAICFICIVVLLTLFKYIYGRFFEDEVDVDVGSEGYQSYTYLFTVMTNQGNCFMSTSVSLRMLAGVWCLACLVLVNAYAGTFVSFMSAPRLMSIPQTLEQLAENNELKMTMEKGVLLTDLILEAKSGVLKSFGDSFRDGSNNIHTSLEQLFAKLNTGKYVTVTAEVEAKFFISEDMKRNKQCRFTLSKKLNYFQSYGFGLPKNGPYNAIINKEFMYMFESGMFNQWMKKYTTGDISKCLNFQGNKTERKPLQLSMLSSIFLVLVVGLTFSLVIFIVEKIARRRHDN